jgi:DMSO/TMAO reductase YedYZ molybdopterin-dependent catalytic subunit
MSLTSKAYGERGRRRAVKQGIDPGRLPPGQSPAAPGKWPVLTVGAAPVVAPEEWKLFVYGEVAEPASFTLEDLLDDDVLVAWAADGEPLSHEHGGPVRLLVPKRYFWKSAKYLQAIELLDHDEPGIRPARPRNGYHNDGGVGGSNSGAYALRPLCVPRAAPQGARRQSIVRTALPATL